MKTAFWSVSLCLLGLLASVCAGSAAEPAPVAPLPTSLLVRLGHARMVCGHPYRLHVTADGAWVGCNDRWFHVADAREGRPVVLPPGYSLERVLEDSAYVVSDDKEHRILTPGSDKPRAVVRVEEGRVLFDARGKVCLHEREEKGTNTFRVAELKPGEREPTWRTVGRVSGPLYRRFLSEQGGHVVWKKDNGSEIGVLELATGRQVLMRFTLEPSDVVRVPAISPDGTRAACRTDRTVRFFDTRTGWETGCIELPSFNALDEIRFTPDGKAVVLASYWDGLLVVPVAADQRVRRLPIRAGKGIQAFALFPDSRRVALADDFGVIRIHDLHTGKQVDAHTRFSCFQGIQMLGEQTAGCWSADGQVVTWDLREGRVLSEVTVGLPGDAPDRFVGMRFSPDGRHVAGWTEAGRCVVARTRSGKRVAARHTRSEEACADFSANEAVGVVSTGEAERPVLELVDLAEGRTVGAVPLPTGRICFSRDGRTVLRAAYHQVSLHETVSGRARWTMNLFTPELRKNDSNELLLATLGQRGRKAYVVREKDAYVLDAWTGKVETMFPLSTRGEWHEQSIAVSERWLAVRCDKNEVDLYDFESRNPETPAGRVSCPGTPIQAVALDHDGGRLITAHGDGICQVWDLKRLPRPAARPGRADLWELLGRTDPAEAQPALVGLLDRPGPAVELLARNLKPVPEVPAERIAGWIRQLDSEDFKTREEANRQLSAVLDQAVEQLPAVEKKPGTLEAWTRARRLLERDKELDRGPERLRQLRAVEVLERIGSPEAKALLQKLAKGAPRAFLTREARESLERLRR
jgi:WD40 repeat protein